MSLAELYSCFLNYSLKINLKDNKLKILSFILHTCFLQRLLASLTVPNVSCCALTPESFVLTWCSMFGRLNIFPETAAYYYVTTVSS